MNRHCNSDDGICRKGCAGNAPCAITQHTETAAPKRWYFLGSTPYVKAADHDHIVAALQTKLNKANERLENNRVYVADPNDPNKLVRKDVEPGSVPDGIECRDETIKLQDEIIERLRRELTAERDAVAQYIGERNELQRKLADYDAGWDAAEHGEAEPPQGTKSTQWLDGYEYWKALEELETLRTKLAQAQNEAYQRGQNDQAKHDGPIVNAAYRDGRNKALDEVLQGCARDLTDMMLESCNLMDVGLQDAAWAHRIRADQECVRYNIVLALKSPNSAEGEPG